MTVKYVIVLCEAVKASAGLKLQSEPYCPAKAHINTTQKSKITDCVCAPEQSGLDRQDDQV